MATRNRSLIRRKRRLARFPRWYPGTPVDDFGAPGPQICLKSPPGALGPVLIFFLPVGPSGCFLPGQGAAGGQKEPSGLHFETHFASNNDAFWYLCRRLARLTFRYIVLTTLSTPALFISCSLGCPRKTVRCLATHKNQWMFMICQCLLGRRARRREDNRREKWHQQ